MNKKVKQIQKDYHRKLKSSNNEETTKQITAEFSQSLHDIGYRITEEGLLTQITPEWNALQADKQAKREDIVKRLLDPDSKVRLAALLELDVS